MSTLIRRTDPSLTSTADYHSLHTTARTTPAGGDRLRVFESTSIMDVPGRHVAVCGDWHGNVGWMRSVARCVRTLAPDVTTIVQVGDWWMDLNASDSICRKNGIERVLVVLGNHEPWGSLTPLLNEHPGQAVRVSEVTWILPRPFQMTLGSRQALALGGATSVDQKWRTEGTDWWPDEAITDDHVAAALDLGVVDLLLTHETPDDTPIAAVAQLLDQNPLGLDEAIRAKSAASRRRVSTVWRAARPSLLIHGHMHAFGEGTIDDGRRVLSLGRDGDAGNLAILDLEMMSTEVPALSQVRGY